MDSQKKNGLEKHYHNNGYDGVIKFIMDTSVVHYLAATEDISKIIELVSLTIREKSIVQYLNYLEGKKRTIVPLYSNIIINRYDGTNVVKLSHRQLKYAKAKVNSLTPNKLAFYESFVGVVELNTDGHSLARAKAKVKKIRALYTASVPYCNIDFTKVIAALQSVGIKSSEQDVIAFLSLILGLSYDGENVNIPTSFWESLFGRRNKKKAKQVFQNLGIVILISESIPSFKSAGYKINLCDAQNVGVRPPIDIKITSIRTLEKLNRIKRYKGNFTLHEKTEALELLIDLLLKDLKMLGRINFTEIFLVSGKLQMLSNDLKRMVAILNDDASYALALRLGIHLTAYFNNINGGNFQDYRALWGQSL